MKKSNEIKRIIDIPIKKLYKNPNSPRHYFDRIKMNELAMSIKENGVIHPITVCPCNRGYMVVSGERRVRASVMAGKRTIPAMIIHSDEQHTAVFALLENLQREDLTFFEVAESYKRLLSMQSVTKEQLAAQFGQNSSSIANKIRLLRLPARVRKLIRDLKMSERHANALLSVEDEELQLKSLLDMHERQLSPPQAEEYIDNICASPDKVQYADEIGSLSGTLAEAVNKAKKNGVSANMRKEEYDSEIEYIISIKK